MHYEQAFPLSDLAPGGVKVVKRGKVQVAVFRTEDDGLYAIDNRCPHEGYPLAQGTTAGCTVTCCYHNFKFDLRDGACLKGDEAVRTVAHRVVDGMVELDLTPPDPRAGLPKIEASWKDAILDQRVGQALRDSVRLLEAGISVPTLFARLVAIDCSHAQYGGTHVMAVCADLLARAPADTGAVPHLAMPLELTTRSVVRRPLRPHPAPESHPDAIAELGRRIEAEDLEGAEALLRGHLAEQPFETLQKPWLRWTTEHFLGFGHGLIYATKVFPFLKSSAAAPAERTQILAGHLVNLVNSTREDLLPGWTRWRRVLADAEPHLDRWWNQERTNSDASALTDSLIRGKVTESLGRLVDALEANVTLDAIVGALIDGANARMLRFDWNHDLSGAVQDNWLSVSHIFTFVEAVSAALHTLNEPAGLRWLFQAVRMVAAHAPLDGPEPAIEARAGSPEQLREALRSRDPMTACNLAAAWLEQGRSSQLVDLLVEHSLDDAAVRGIYLAHYVKVAVSAESLGNHDGFLAAVRFISSPTRERNVRRLADEAVAFVLEGKTPTLLVP